MDNTNHTNNINPVNECNYYIAQNIIEKMLSLELISLSEFNKITKLNRKSFSPFLAEIMPDQLDNTATQR